MQLRSGYMCSHKRESNHHSPDESAHNLGPNKLVAILGSSDDTNNSGSDICALLDADIRANHESIFNGGPNTIPSIGIVS